VNPEGRERVKQLLAQAARIDQPLRKPFIESAAQGDAEVLAELLELLDTLDDSVFMSAPTGAGFAGPSAPVTSGYEGPGTRIGRYKLLQPIGEGGFGTVFMAEQTEPVHRRVALKIIKAGMDTKQVIARFEAERQALAMMDHPNIARVLDAGATDAGRPYFVMELVRGEPVTRYCDQERLPVRKRLELFRDVCNAVQHAHQKGVIHRDLKPTNVLVTVADGEPLPKVIDFGIAKATAGRLTDKTLFTEMHQLIGTPEYMSPEQAEISGVDIDTRSDIFSLGVMLYELLVGSTPLEGEKLRSTPLVEIQRLIREEEAPRPSLRLATAALPPRARTATPKARIEASRASAMEIAHRRQSEPPLLSRTIRGDLDWIVMKCLEKDRRRRYPTASALADDIGLYLSHEPVSAIPPSAGYKLRKFVQRNRTMVLAGSVIAAVLVLGVVGTTLGLLWALRERHLAHAQKNIAQASAAMARSEADRADREAKQARAVNDFMREVLTSVSPQNRGADVRLIDVLASASATAAQRFADHPLQEAQVRDMLGQIYDNLTTWPEAMAEYQKALALWKQHDGDDDPRTLSSQYLCAGMAINLQRPYEAERELKDLALRSERVFGADDTKLLDVRRSMAIVQLQRGRVDEAERILLELRAHPRAAADDRLQDRIVQSLIDVKRHQANTEDPVRRREVLNQSEPLAREWVERSMRRHGPTAVLTFSAQSNLGLILVKRGRYQAAADISRAILEQSVDSLGECHHVRALAMSTLALALSGLGEGDEPADLYLRRVECTRRHNPPESPQLLSDFFDALRFLDRGRRPKEGEALARELTAALQRLGGGHGEIVFDSELYTARFVSMQGRLDEAEPLFLSLLDRETQAGRKDRARLHLFYASQLTRRGLFAEAEQHLATAVGLIEDIRVGTWETHPDDVILGYIELYDAWGKPDKAEEYRRLRAEVIGARAGIEPGGK